MDRLPGSQSLEYFQQKCYNYNIPNKLVEIITTLDFQNDRLESGLHLMLKALNLMFDQNPGYQITLEDVTSLGKTSLTKNGTVIDLGDIFEKAFDGTYENNGPIGTRLLEQKNIITLSLLYLNNFGFLQFDKHLDYLLFSLAVEEENNGQVIIWCLLAIFRKCAREGIGEEILPTWLPMSFISTSKITICKKIISSLTPIAERFPNIFIKKSKFEKFWEMVKDDSQVMVFDNFESFEESLFIELLELAEAPAFSDDHKIVQRIITISCTIFDNINIDLFDKDRFSFIKSKFSHLKQPINVEEQLTQMTLSKETTEGNAIIEELQNYMNVLKMEIHENFLPVVSDATENLLMRLKVLDLQRFENFLELHRDTLNFIVRKYHFTWLYQILTCYPKQLVLDLRVLYYDKSIGQSSTLDLLSECLEQYQVSTYEQRRTIACAVVKLSVHIDNNDDQFYNMARHYRATINEIFRETAGCPQAGAFCSMCLKYPSFLDENVKRLYVEFGLIHLCPTDVETIFEDIVNLLLTLTDERKIFGTLSKIDRFLRILAPTTLISDSIRFKVLQYAENHRSIINMFLQNSDSCDHLLKLLVDKPSLLSKNIKSFNTSGKIIFHDAIISHLGNSPPKEKVSELLHTMEELFLYLKPEQKSRYQFIDFATKNSKILNEVILEKKKCFEKGAILEVLGSIPQVLNFEVKITFIEKIVRIWKHKELLNILSECLFLINPENDSINLPELKTSINLLCQTLTNKTIRKNNKQYYNFAEEHHTIIKYLLKNCQDIGPTLFKMVAPFPEFCDFDMKMRFLELFLQINAEESHWELLEGCMERYSQELTADQEEKYKDLLNDILTEQTDLSIASFLAYFPQLMSFDNKIEHLSMVLNGNDLNFCVMFLWECLTKLKWQYPEEYARKICSAVNLAITRIPMDETEILHELADEYPTQLKTVHELIGFDEAPVWKLILNRLGIPYMDFESKVEAMREQLTREKPRSGNVQLEVNRSTVFFDSYFIMNTRSLQSWNGHFKIKFINENGVDGGGLMREWFTILTREIFNPNYALFTTASDDNNSYTMNKASHVNPEHLDYFKFVGRFIGKSIMEKQFVDCPFTKSLYKHILNIPVGFEDFQDEDPNFCNSLKELLKNPVAELGLELTFSTEVEEFGTLFEKELKKNGKYLEVTDENKKEYVTLLCQMKMTGSTQKQLDSFLSGFYDIIPKHLITVFTVKELELLICGEPEIDINDLEANAKYERYKKSDTAIQWFWRAVRSFDKDDKARLLMFVTGSSKSPPGGFASNPEKQIMISKGCCTDGRLPTAHTCAYKLVLPQYGSYEKLRKSLLLAIRECSEGFGFS